MLRRSAAAVLLAASLPAAAEPAWTRQSVPGHDVSVELPGPGEHRQKERSLWVGKVVTDSLVVKDADGWCAATVTRPPRMAALVGDDKMIGTARDRVLEDYRGRQVSWTAVRRDGREGMRLVFDSQRHPDRPERGVAEFFTVDGNVVTVLAVRAADAPLDLERMFTSVDLGR